MITYQGCPTGGLWTSKELSWGPQIPSPDITFPTTPVAVARAFGLSLPTSASTFCLIPPHLTWARWEKAEQPREFPAVGDEGPRDSAVQMMEGMQCDGGHTVQLGGGRSTCTVERRHLQQSVWQVPAWQRVSMWQHAMACSPPGIQPGGHVAHTMRSWTALTYLFERTVFTLIELAVQEHQGRGAWELALLHTMPVFPKE